MILGFIAGIGLGILRGIVASLRNSGRSRRRVRAADGAAPAHLSLVQSDTKVPEFREPEQLPADPAEATQETTMNPLARLMERMRRSAPAGKADAGATNSTPAQAGRTREYPYTNVPGAEPRANEESAAMYPYPPQPQAYPQSPYPYAPQQFQHQAPQFQQPQPQHHAPQFQQPAYPPNYAQPQQYPPHFAPQPVAYPYPPASPPQPAFHAWQAQPAAFDVYGRPQPVAAPYAPYPASAPHAPATSSPQAQPAYPPEPYPAAASRELSPIEEVRESLREFRDAIRDLTENRARRSY